MKDVVAECVHKNEEIALNTKKTKKERNIAAHLREAMLVILKWPTDQREASIRALKAEGERAKAKEQRPSAL